MSKLLATMLSLTTVIALSGTAGLAQTSCPPEVASAKAMLTQTAKSQEIEAPRSLAGARTQDIQAPRTQELQAPRTQELQAPRSANFTQASGLVTEAEAACRAGNSSLATAKAKAAMDLMK
jgi:hypothetical protein